MKRKKGTRTPEMRRHADLRRAILKVGDGSLLTLLSNVSEDYRIAVAEKDLSAASYRYRHNDLVARLRKSLAVSLGVYDV